MSKTKIETKGILKFWSAGVLELKKLKRQRVRQRVRQ